MESMAMTGASTFAYCPSGEALPPLFEQADVKLDFPEQVRAEEENAAWRLRSANVARDDHDMLDATINSSSLGQASGCKAPQQPWALVEQKEEQRPLSGFTTNSGKVSHMASRRRSQANDKGQTPPITRTTPPMRGRQPAYEDAASSTVSRGNPFLSRRASTPALTSYNDSSRTSLKRTDRGQRPTSRSSTLLHSYQAKSEAPSTHSTAMEFSHSYGGFDYASQLMSPASFSDDADSTGVWSVAASPMCPTFPREHFLDTTAAKMQRSQSTPFSQSAYAHSLPAEYLDDYTFSALDNANENMPVQHVLPVTYNGMFGIGGPQSISRGRHAGRHQSASAQGGLKPGVAAQYLESSYLRPAGVMQRKRKPSALNTNIIQTGFPTSCQTAPLERIERPQLTPKRSFDEFDNLDSFDSSPVQVAASTPVSKRSRSAFNTPGSTNSPDVYEDASSLSPELLWMPAAEPTDVQGLGLASQSLPYSPTGFESSDSLASPNLDGCFSTSEYLQTGYGLPAAPLSPCDPERTRFAGRSSKQRFVMAPQVPSSPTNNRHTFENAQQPRSLPYNAQASPLSPSRRGKARRNSQTSRRGIPAGAAREISFCNFTAADKKVILSGVAPSGSTKKPTPVAGDGNMAIKANV